MPRKPIGVWMLTMDGQPWNFENFATVGEAMTTARTLRLLPPRHDPDADLPLFVRRSRCVWIARPAAVGLKPERKRFRKGSRQC